MLEDWSLILLGTSNKWKYTKEKARYCETEKYGNYYTLESAKKACEDELNCVAVVDDACDNKGTFWLCPSTGKISSSEYGSCVYVKVRNMFYFKFVILMFTYSFILNKAICYCDIF